MKFPVTILKSLKFMHVTCMIPETCVYHAGIWDVFQVWNMHGLVPKFHAFFMQETCMKSMYMHFMHETCIFQAYSMHGTGEGVSMMPCSNVHTNYGSAANQWILYILLRYLYTCIWGGSICIPNLCKSCSKSPTLQHNKLCMSIAVNKLCLFF